jgi:hypothetical protein
MTQKTSTATYTIKIFIKILISSKVLREYLLYIYRPVLYKKKLTDYFVALGLFLWAVFNDNHNKKIDKKIKL